MNADPTGLSYDEELRYLVLLTVAGIKPLSRWEMQLDQDQLGTLELSGLQISTLTRSTEWGRLVTHTIFSRQSSLVQRHKAAFDGCAISAAASTIRREGLDFGYPRCCVEAFIEFGYQRNGLSPQEQGILFHWACPNCERTQMLLPRYRHIYLSLISGG
jgi:hypothetical protein